MLDLRKKLVVAGVPLVLGAMVLRYGWPWAVAEVVGMSLWIIPVGTRLIGARHLVRRRWSVPVYGGAWTTVVFPAMAFSLYEFGVAIGWVLGVTAAVAAWLTWLFWPGRRERLAADPDVDQRGRS